MSKIERRGALAILSLLASLYAATASAEGPQPLSPAWVDWIVRQPQRTATEAGAIEHLVAMQRQVPALFNQSWLYDVDLLELSVAERRLVETLNGIPAYRRQLAARPGFLDIEIAPPKEGLTVELRASDPSAPRLLRERLEGALTRHYDGVKPPAEWAREVLSSYDRLAADGTPLFVRAAPLFAEVPKEAQRELKSRNQLERLERLRRYYDTHRVPTGLEAARKALDESIAHLQAMEEIRPKVALAAWIAVSGPKDAEALKKGLVLISNEQVSRWRDVDDAVAPAVERLLGKKPNAKVLEQVPLSMEGIPDPVQKFDVKPRILREVPPALGALRGGCGGNCDTAYSFGYSYAPTERIFFVYAPSGTLLGYVMGRTVKTGDKSAFYVVTIDGPSLTPADAIAVTQALHRERAALGVDEILLPTKDAIVGLMNHETRFGVADEAQRGTLMPFTHADEQVRKALEGFEHGDLNSTSYNKMKQNVEGMRVVARASFGGLTVEAKPSVEPPPTPKKATPAEKLSLALNLAHGGFRGSASRVLPHVGPSPGTGLTDPQFVELMKHLGNEAGLSIAEQEGAFLEAARRFGVDGVTDAFVAANRELFYRGRLRAKDAFSDEHRAETYNQMLRDLKRRLGSDEAPEAKWETFQWHLAGFVAAKEKALWPYVTEELLGQKSITKSAATFLKMLLHRKGPFSERLADRLLAMARDPAHEHFLRSTKFIGLLGEASRVYPERRDLFDLLVDRSIGALSPDYRRQVLLHLENPARGSSFLPWLLEAAEGNRVKAYEVAGVLAMTLHERPNDAEVLAALHGVARLDADLRYSAIEYIANELERSKPTSPRLLDALATLADVRDGAGRSAVERVVQRLALLLQHRDEKLPTLELMNRILAENPNARALVDPKFLKFYLRESGSDRQLVALALHAQLVRRGGDSIDLNGILADALWERPHDVVLVRALARVARSRDLNVAQNAIERLNMVLTKYPTHEEITRAFREVIRESPNSYKADVTAIYLDWAAKAPDPEPAKAPFLQRCFGFGYLFGGSS